MSTLHSSHGTILYVEARRMCAERPRGQTELLLSSPGGFARSLDILPVELQAFKAPPLRSRAQVRAGACSLVHRFRRQRADRHPFECNMRLTRQKRVAWVLQRLEQGRSQATR